MKKRLASIAALVLMIVLMVPFVMASNQPEPAYAAPPQGCILDISGVIGIVICGGEVVEQLPLPTIKVTENVVEEVIKTIRVPGPTTTVTVKEPGSRETVYIAGPTATATVRVTDGVTETVRVQPSAAPSADSEPSVGPSELPQETVTISPSGQPGPSSGNLSPAEPEEPGSVVERVVEKIDSPAEVIGVSTLTLLAVVGIILLGMYAGYILGYKNADRENATFMKSLSDMLLIRGKKR